MSKPSSKKTAKQRKRRKKYLKEKNLIKPFIIRTHKRRKEKLFDLARQGGEPSKKAMRLLMGFLLTKQEDEELRELWIEFGVEERYRPTIKEQ